MTERNSTRAPAPNQAKKQYVRNTEQFVAKATRLHDGLYSYLKSDYRSSQEKVVITCKLHGDFLLTPNKHLKGFGCQQCSAELKANKRRKGTEQFIKEAAEKHKGFYSYDKVKYKNSQTKVTITCPKHGDFKQAAGSHLGGCACPKCYQESRFLTQERFLEKCIAAHGLGKFDYSEAVYVSSSDDVKLTCLTCGDVFYQTADRHMRGAGCGNCAGTKKVTQEDYIAQAIARFGNRFDYSEVNLVNKSNKIKIRCKLHGAFYQSAYYHLISEGCPKCAKSKQGYTKSDFEAQCAKNNKGQGTLYIIRCYSPTEMFYKIGRTSNSVKKRFCNSVLMPYSFDVVYQIEGTPSFVYDLEVRLHRLNSKNSYQPSKKFQGETECFTSIELIEPLLKELTTTEQLQLLA